MKMGIKYKLIFFMSSLLLIVICFLSIFVLNGIKEYQNKQVLNILFKQKDMFEQYFSEKAMNSEDGENIQLYRGSIFNKPWLRNIPANIYDKDGVMLSGFKNDIKVDENRDKDKMIQYAINGQIAYKEQNSTVYFYSPIKHNNKTIAILELQYSNEDNELFYKNIKNMFLIIGFISLLSGIIAGIIYFSKFTKDIYILKDYVKDIEQGEFEKVKELSRNDEIGDLSKGLVFTSSTINNNIKDLQKERDSLSLALEKLKQMDAKQKEFIGSVTHEFKTPITTIKAYADLIGMYKDDIELINEGTGTISKECDRLSLLVDKVLNLSILEKYDFEIEKSKVNLKEVLTDIADRMKGRIKKNNLTLYYEFKDIEIMIDKENLKHIVINLIDNAIKYNKPDGGITMRCYKSDIDIVIEISDTGIGIPKEDIPKIFEPFYRVDKHRSRESGGSGLGLALVKKLVEKQNGNIEVVSQINRGSTFFIRFYL